MPNLIPAIIKDLMDGNTDVYTNSTGGNVLVKSLLLEHKNTPNRLISSAGSVPQGRNFISAPQMLEENTSNNSYLSANLDGANRIVVLGTANYQETLASGQSGNGWLQILEYDSVNGGYYSYPVCEMSQILNSGDVAQTAQILVLSPTKFCVLSQSTVSTFKVNADYTITEIGYLALGFSANLMNQISMVSVYDSTDSTTLNQTKIVFSYVNSGVVSGRVMNVPDSGNPSWATAAVTLITLASVATGQMVRATKLGNKFLAYGHTSAGTSIQARSYSFDPSTNTFTAISAQTAIVFSYGVSVSRIASFSGGSAGGSAGDGTEFNAQIFGFQNNTGLSGNEFFYVSHTNDTTLGTTVVAAGNASYTAFASLTASPVKINDNLVSMAGYGGCYAFGRNGAGGVFNSLYYTAAATYAYFLPFRSKAVLRQGNIKYLLSLTSAITDTSNSLPATTNPVYVPMGYPSNKCIKWHPTLNCYIAVNGGRYVFALDANGVQTGYGDMGANSMVTCLDVSPSGKVFFGGGSSSSMMTTISLLDTSTSDYGQTWSATVSGTTGSAILPSIVAGSTPTGARMCLDIICTDNDIAWAIFLYYTSTGPTYGFTTANWTTATSCNTNSAFATVATRLFWSWHTTCLYRHTNNVAFSTMTRNNAGTIELWDVVNTTQANTQSANSSSARRNLMLSVMNTLQTSLVAIPGQAAFLNMKPSTGNVSASFTWTASAVIPANTKAYAAVNDLGIAIGAYSYTNAAIQHSSMTLNVVKPDSTVDTYTDASRANYFFHTGRNGTMKISFKSFNGVALNTTLEGFGAVTTNAYFYLVDGSGNSVKLAKDALVILAGDVKKSVEPIVIPNNGKLRVNLDKKYQLDAYLTVLTGV